MLGVTIRERPFGFVVIGGPASDPKFMLADPRYDSNSFRQDLLDHGILSVIPSGEGCSTPQKTDWRRNWERNRIERMFNRLKQMRRIATRYDKTALSLARFLNLDVARFSTGSFIGVA